MKKLIASAVTALFLTVSVTAMANDYKNDTSSSNDMSSDNGNAAGTAADETAGTSQAQASELTQGVFKSPLTITPAVGALGYGDGLNNYTSRITEGFNLDLNASNLVPMLKSTGIISGFETGFLYSHIGAASSNFFGANPSSGLNAGANSFLIPAELTFGYNISQNGLLALKLGTNMLYRSDASSMVLGRSDDLNGVGSSVVDFFPSIGLNAGWSLGKTAAIELRGDYIPTPAKDMFNAMLGLTFPLA